MDRVRVLLREAGVLYADETPARAAGRLEYVYVACTGYLTAMYTGGRSATDIDVTVLLVEAGGAATLSLAGRPRDSTAYRRLPPVHRAATCGGGKRAGRCADPCAGLLCVLRTSHASSHGPGLGSWCVCCSRRSQLVLFPRLLGRDQPDLHQVEQADEAVADAEAPSASDRIPKRHRPVVLQRISAAAESFGMSSSTSQPSSSVRTCPHPLRSHFYSERVWADGLGRITP